uniref:Dof-type domain-containing protein n=1 Tax=Oryza brachyantha TaxID=4533 RepID=J3KVF9_ORYBR
MEIYTTACCRDGVVKKRSTSCRRYWMHGGSLRNIPIGSSTCKRPRAARPTHAAVAATASAGAATTPRFPSSSSSSSQLQQATNATAAANQLVQEAVAMSDDGSHRAVPRTRSHGAGGACR